MFWIIALILFVTVTFLFWKLTHNYYKKQFGNKMWKIGGPKTFYWANSLMFCGAITVVLLKVLKWSAVISA